MFSKSNLIQIALTVAVIAAISRIPAARAVVFGA